MAKKLRVIELYAGTARTAEAFRGWRRCEIALLVDNDPYAKETYECNRPNAPYVVENLEDCSSERIETLASGRTDILLGCPPCQGFSDNTPRNPWDRRNRHLRHFARIAVGLKPRAIAMENVPLSGGSRAFRLFCREIQRAGYRWTAGIINAALRGSCQCRQRLLFVAVHKSVGAEPVFPKPTHGGRRSYFNYNTEALTTLAQAPTSLLGVAPATFQVRASLPYVEADIGVEPIPYIREQLSGLPRDGSTKANRIAHFAWAHSRRQIERMRNVPEGGQLNDGKRYYSQSYGRLHRRGIARTITTAFPNAGSGRFWHPTKNRSLTLREAARIQGFPDEFEFIPPYSRAAFLVGNALDHCLADLSYSIIRASLE